MSVNKPVAVNRLATTEVPWVRRLLIGIALAWLALFLLLPLVSIFVEGLQKGISAYLAAFDDPNVWSAIRLTLLAAVISVPLNLVFGARSGLVVHVNRVVLVRRNYSRAICAVQFLFTLGVWLGGLSGDSSS